MRDFRHSLFVVGTLRLVFCEGQEGIGVCLVVGTLRLVFCEGQEVIGVCLVLPEAFFLTVYNLNTVTVVCYL